MLNVYERNRMIKRDTGVELGDLIVREAPLAFFIAFFFDLDRQGLDQLLPK